MGFLPTFDGAITTKIITITGDSENYFPLHMYLCVNHEI